MLIYSLVVTLYRAKSIFTRQRYCTRAGAYYLSRAKAYTRARNIMPGEGGAQFATPSGKGVTKRYSPLLGCARCRLGGRRASG